MGTGRLQCGLNGLGQGQRFSPTVDWIQWSTFSITAGALGELQWSDAAAVPYLDPATGELKNPQTVTSGNVVTAAYYQWYTPADNPQYGNFDNYVGAQWIIKWDGTVTDFWVTNTGAGASATLDAANKKIYWTFGNNFAQVAFRLYTTYTDPARNVSIYLAKNATQFASGQRFDPDWLAQVSKFGRLRTMDWQRTNGSGIVNYADFTSNTRRYSPWPASASLQMIVDLANQAGVDVHVCIPHQATPACVTSMATFLRDNITAHKVIYEYSNETWNYSGDFSQTTYCDNQAAAMGFANGRVYSGYQSTLCMKLIRDVYGGAAGRNRWEGALGTQAASSGVTQYVVNGALYYLQNTLVPANSLQISDLYNDLYVAGYFSEVQQGFFIWSALVIGNPTTLKVWAHPGWGVGTEVKFICDSPILKPYLDKKFATISAVTVVPDHSPPTLPSGNGWTEYTVGIDTTGMAPYTDNSINTCNWVALGSLYRLMDYSATLSTTDPYAYYAQQFKKAAMHGATDTGSWGTWNTTSVDVLIQNWFPPHQTIVNPYGLGLCMYEAGSQYVGDVYRQMGYEGGDCEPQFKDFMLSTGWRQEMADVFTYLYNQFFAMTGGVVHWPSKFVEAGIITKYGTWPGMRHLGDSGNPVWQAVLTANGVSAVLISPTTLPPGMVGTAYTAQTLTASGGTSPYTWSHTGTVPPGLTFNDATATLDGGSPTTSGDFTFTVNVHDSAATQLTGNQSYTVHIAPSTGPSVRFVYHKH